MEENEFRSSGDEPLKNPLVKCTVCGFQYVTPRLNSARVLDGYINAVDETFVSQAKGRELTFKRCLAEVERVWGKRPGRILDVGTANGSFLKVAKDAGWKVTGCEPNRWMCDWCGKNYGIKITQGTIFDSNCSNETFDVVTLWDVLEHTPDPMAAMRECVRVLRPGGLLVVNYPDIGSWIARLMGQRWVFLLSVHYYYFTRETIRRASKLAGLEIVTIKPHFQTLEFDYVLFRATPYVGALARIARAFVRFAGLSKAQIPYWVGQTLVIAQKKGQMS
jgi:2-polyprenyl-3-methyl-5-hydroxy-6-metoxy-1,4-benzoquinol methylase